MRVVAIIATYNEELFISECIRHYRRQGVDVYLIDNESTDNTLAIARLFLNRGVVGIETLKRRDKFSLKEQLEVKEKVARRVNADWVIHADADEIRLPPRSDQTLRSALREAEAGGYNAVNFLEFTFIPTQEEPDHEQRNFVGTMRWYYHFSPHYPFHIKAWKPAKLPDFSLAPSGGHLLSADGLALSPVDFKFRHYLFLSSEHARRKYMDKVFAVDELDKGWHGWRASLTPSTLVLPSQSELIEYIDDDNLDSSNPLPKHLAY